MNPDDENLNGFGTIPGSDCGGSGFDEGDSESAETGAAGQPGPDSKEDTSYWGDSSQPVGTYMEQVHGSREPEVRQEYGQQRGYGGEYGPEAERAYEQRERYPKPVSGMAIAALILGSLSIVTCCCGVGGMIFGSLGIIIAIMSKGQEPMQTNAKIGLGLSIAGLVLGILMTIFLFAFGNYGNEEKNFQSYDYYDVSPYDSYDVYPGDGTQTMPYDRSLEDFLNESQNQEL